MQSYHGSCHCGAVSFSFRSEEIENGMRCNCSICSRKGAILSDFVLSPDNLEILGGEAILSSYQFGTHVAKHYFCSRCGIFTHVSTRLNPGMYRVNLGCVEDVDPFSLVISIFDGTEI